MNFIYTEDNQIKDYLIQHNYRLLQEQKNMDKIIYVFENIKPLQLNFNEIDMTKCVLSNTFFM